MPSSANQPAASGSPEFLDFRAQTPSESTGRARRAFTLVALAVAIAAVGVGIHWALTHTQDIRDQVRVWTFTSSETIDGYADRAMMTDRGRFLLIASHPEVRAVADFDTACASGDADVGVLGCYDSNTQTIALLAVDNPALDGIADVVAAHEMLHAAWDRMDESERAAVTPLLEAEAATQAADPGFTERMSAYAGLPPAGYLDELHSIIGTERATIAPALETHYAEYFTGRAQLVEMHQRSHAVFIELEDRSNVLVAELTALRDRISDDYSSYTVGYDALGADIDSFSSQAGSGTMTKSRYDSARAALVARQSALDSLYATVEANSAAFDAMNAELEALNVRAVALNASLNIAPRTDSVN